MEIGARKPFSSLAKILTCIGFAIGAFSTWAAVAIASAPAGGGSICWDCSFVPIEQPDVSTTTMPVTAAHRVHLYLYCFMLHPPRDRVCPFGTMYMGGRQVYDTHFVHKECGRT